ncbi:hypothetical protein HY212_05755 [Candidatus Pacearchaeota archaeon]|nr:hypothetical protein [Candidatus Pacearchaeota archaeon]
MIKSNLSNNMNVNNKLYDKLILNKNRLINKDYISSNANINRSIKLILLLLSFLAIIVLQIYQTSAIGITPGRTTINFQPGLIQEVNFSIVNTEHKDMSVVFFVQGALNESVTLKQTYAKLSASDDSKSFSYLISLPQKFDKPGVYSADIVALEMPKDLENQGTFVGATVSVATQAYVYVPYPNKYLEGEINIVPDDSGKILFLMPVVNRGKLDIVNAKAVIDIYTALNEKVASFETESQSLASLERKELVAEWKPSVNPGKYLAVVNIVYDNEIANLSKEFNVGESLVEINDLYVKDFSLGEIAKFNALVENKWGNEIKDSYLNILVYNKDGETMADFKSPNYDLKALSKTEMVAYWDTGGVQQGNYDGKLILKYGDKSAERNIQLKISESNIEISGVTGKVLVRGKGSSSVNSLLVILIVVLVAANVIWFFVVKRFMKKKK